MRKEGNHTGHLIVFVLAFLRTYAPGINEEKADSDLGPGKMPNYPAWHLI
jgi:hypothetical protein